MPPLPEVVASPRYNARGWKRCGRLVDSWLMAVASDSFTGIDLSRLSAPDLIEVLSYEEIFARNVALFQTLYPAFDATVESDPLVKVIQLFSYKEMLMRQRVNEAGKATMAAFALKADLDQVAALVGVERYILAPGNPEAGIEPVYEDDESLRRRMVLAPEGFSVAGPEGAYIFHALTADSDVLDASAVSPEPDDIKALVLATLAAHSASAPLVTAMTEAMDSATWPGEVEVTLLSRTDDGAVGPDVIANVDARLSDTSVRPLTDHVIVQGAEIVPFAISATMTFLSGPDRSVVLETAKKQLDTFLANTRRLGRDITRAGIIAALFPEGVQNIVLHSPAADVVLNRQQAQYCTDIELIDAGVGE